MVSPSLRPTAGRARVELYIDTGMKEDNKELFAYFEDSKNEIEDEIGEQLHWDRLDNKRACRISAFRSGSIESNQTELDQLKAWMVETLPKVRKVFKQRIEVWRDYQDES